jgi:hypothetical protein
MSHLSYGYGADVWVMMDGSPECPQRGDEPQLLLGRKRSYGMDAHDNRVFQALVGGLKTLVQVRHNSE